MMCIETRFIFLVSLLAKMKIIRSPNEIYYVCVCVCVFGVPTVEQPTKKATVRIIIIKNNKTNKK